MLINLVKRLTHAMYKTKWTKPIPRKDNTTPKQKSFLNWRIIKGDIVMLRAGDDKGKVGKVLKVLRKLNRVIVKGVNMHEYTKIYEDRKMRARKASSIHISNVGLYDQSINKPVRVMIGYHPVSGAKLRVSKKTGKILYKKGINKTKRARRGKHRKPGVKDTPVALAQKVTYEGEDFAAIKREFQAFIAEKQAREKYLWFKE